jgi:hypothetical protein
MNIKHTSENIFNGMIPKNIPTTSIRTKSLCRDGRYMNSNILFRQVELSSISTKEKS